MSLEDIYLGISETRNPNLANVFFRLNYVEGFGTGIGRIIESYQEYDKKPLFVDSDNAFKVMLPNINFKEGEEKILSSSLSQEEQIIQYLKKNNKITRLIVEKLLDVSSTRAKQILNSMIKQELIIANGTGKNIIYVLK